SPGKRASEPERVTGGSSPPPCCCPFGGVGPAEAFEGRRFSRERRSECHGRAALLRHTARRLSALSCTHPWKGFSSESPCTLAVPWDLLSPGHCRRAGGKGEPRSP
ncbi:unnamed protein product, partial [Coccothraustes coccothraustes]